MRITDEASRPFDQNTGGFQLGADMRFDAFHGDLYVGGFLSYFNASRDFLDGDNGSTNALSLGTYATWLNPEGWYADLVLKYTQLWNYFNTPASDGSITTAQYSVPALGGSLEIGKRFNVGEFFIEPEAQLAGVWEGGNNYSASNGLTVGGSDQYSLRGRLGVRAGMHFALSNGMALEPYLKVSAVHEFLTGDQITLNDMPFFPSASGTMVDAAAGLSARVNQSFSLYGEYDYANGDRIRQPWAVNLVGGGDAITQRTLAGGDSMMVIGGVLLVRFGFGPVSYAAGTPGGLFAPMLVLGAQSGLVLGTLFCRWFPYLAERPTAFAVVGMAAFFTAVVRAPVTGIILVTEMTGCFTLLLPMLLACFAAMTVPTLLGDPPIYDSLRRPGVRQGLTEIRTPEVTPARATMVGDSVAGMSPVRMARLTLEASIAAHSGESPIVLAIPAMVVAQECAGVHSGPGCKQL